MTNYKLIQYFLDMIGEFAISNPTKEITKNFVYSNIMRFNIKKEQQPYVQIDSLFEHWKSRYKNNNNINIFEVQQRPFLWFSHGEIKGNEIKMYIPLDYQHIKEGANQLFDFIASEGIEHQSKIANKIRNDNIVVRVNSLEDAKKIIDFVENNDYIKEGLIKTNPFLANCNGVGLAMDNNYSYNSTISQIISEFVMYLREHNRMDLLTVDNLNDFICKRIPMQNDEDLKDIYILLSKATDRNFELQDFIDHAENKLIDVYSLDRTRITTPSYYLERAIKLTNSKYPQNCEKAILEYLNGNPNYFTNLKKGRQGIIKYVKPGDLINIMRSKLNQEGINIPNTDRDLINSYLNIVLPKNYEKSFNIICSAYINTEKVYDEYQARGAIRELLLNNDIRYFTNRFNDRTNLKDNVLGHNIKKIILNNIDIDNLDVNDYREIIKRFLDVVHNKNKSVEKK